MAQTTEIDNLVVRLGLDAKPYAKGLKQSTAATEKYVRDVNGKLRDARGKFVNDHKIMLESTKRLGFGMKKVGAMATIYSAQLKKVGKNAMKTGRMLSLRLTAPIGIIGGLAVRSFAKFDQAMTESTSIMKVTGDEVEAMKKQALDLARVAPQGPDELARSYFFLASAGKNAQQSMALLPKVMAFSTAGAFEMSLATDLLTDAQSALGMSSKNVAVDTANLTLISDSLVKANTIANASVQQFAESLTSDAATAAQSFGQDLSTTMAILSLYADKGKKGAEAGNLFGRATRLLTKAARDNADVFAKHNIRVVDKATGKYRTFIEILEDMNVAFEGMAKPKIAGVLSDLGFEALAQKSILPLLGSTDALEAYLKELKEVGDVTDDVANKQLKSFSNQMKIAKNNLEVMGISLGEQLAPKLEGLGKTIASLTRGWEGLSNGSKGAIVNIGLTLAAVGPLVLAFGVLVRVLGFVATSTAMATRGFRIMRVSMARTTITAKLLKVAMLGLKVAVAAGVFIGAFQLGQWLAGAAKHARDLRVEFDKMSTLAGEASDRFSKKTTDILASAPDDIGAKRVFLTEQLEQATRELEGTQLQVRILNKTVEESEMTWLSLGQAGDAQWKLNIQLAKEAEARVKDNKKRIEELATALGQASVETVAMLQQQEAAAAESKRQAALEASRKEVDKLIGSIRQANMEFGLTADQVEVIHQQMKGATVEQLLLLDKEQEVRRELKQQQEIRETNERLAEDAAKQAERHVKALKANAAAIIKSQRSPLQIFTDKMTELQELLDKGFLSETQFGTAREAANAEMEELKKQLAADKVTIPVQFKMVTGRAAGSAQALAELEDIAFRAMQRGQKQVAGVGRGAGAPKVNGMPTAPVPAPLPVIGPVADDAADISVAIRELLGVSIETRDATREIAEKEDTPLGIGMG